MLRLITLAEALIILDITTETASYNFFIMHCFKENYDKRTAEEASRRAMLLLRSMQDATHQ